MYLPNKRAGRYRWGPSVVVVVASARHPTAPRRGGTHGPRSHLDLRGHAALGPRECGRVDGFAVGGAREHGRFSGAPARRLGLKRSSITRAVRAVVVDGADEHGGVGGCDVVLEDERAILAHANQALVESLFGDRLSSDEDEAPVEVGYLPGRGVAGIGAAAAPPPMLPSPLPGLRPRSPRPRPPRPLASRPGLCPLRGGGSGQRGHGWWGAPSVPHLRWGSVRLAYSARHDREWMSPWTGGRSVSATSTSSAGCFEARATVPPRFCQLG